MKIPKLIATLAAGTAVVCSYPIAAVADDFAPFGHMCEIKTTWDNTHLECRAALPGEVAAARERAAKPDPDPMVKYCEIVLLPNGMLDEHPPCKMVRRSEFDRLIDAEMAEGGPTAAMAKAKAELETLQRLRAEVAAKNRAGK